MPRMASKPISDPRRHSPFRTPHWRWEEGLNHFRNNTCPDGWEDPAIAQACQFLNNLGLATTDAARMALSQRCPDLSAARAIYAAGGAGKDELEARLLCQEPDAIAAGMNISADIVRIYATYFFDVLDARHATDWMLAQAVGLFNFSSPPTEGQNWRYLAWFGGPHVLDLVIADHLGLSRPTVSDLHDLADRARFLVREHASYIRTGNPADPEFVAEFRKRYRSDCRRKGIKPDPQQLLQLKILALAAPRRRRPRVKLDSPQSETHADAGLDEQNGDKSDSLCKTKSSRPARHQKLKQPVSQDERNEQVADLFAAAQQ